MEIPGSYIAIILFLVGIFIVFYKMRKELNLINVKDSILNLFKKITYQQEIKEVLAIRDKNAIYQNGQIVAKIRGEININQQIIIIYDIVNSEKLDLKNQFEYLKFKLKFVKRGPLCLTSFEDGVLMGRTYEWIECEIIA